MKGSGCTAPAPLSFSQPSGVVPAFTANQQPIVMRRLRFLIPLLPLLVAAPAHAQQQDTAGGWDLPRALGLVELARERRLRPGQDTTLTNYTAHAEGFVYFYLDRRNGDDRTLIKTDQVALELYWAQPDLTAPPVSV